MVLVTTGLLETLPEDQSEQVLFLGEWCKLYKHKNIYESYTHTTLPYHWDDRQKLYEDTKYIDTIYERYLIQFQQQLNVIHNVDFSIGYWRIIIGPWLRYFIEILYDRYLSIEEASKNDIDYTMVINIDEADMIPLDMSQFNSFYIDDSWNHYIYSAIAPFFKIQVKSKTLPLHSKKTILEKKQSIKEKIKNSLFLLNKLNSIHFFSSYIKYPNLLWLQIRLCQFPALGGTVRISENYTYSKTLRDSIVLPEHHSLFEEILNTLIKKQLPIIYLEGYEIFRTKVLEKYPKRAKIIFTANAHSSDEPFKFWTAEKKEYGAKYIISQHGGHMGTGLFASHEDHQIKSSDKFFSWGWNNHKYPNILPSSTININQNILYNPQGDIIMPLMALPRYSYHIMTMPIAGQILKYFNDQINFLQLLPSNIQKTIKLRTHPNDYRWQVKQRFLDKGFKNQIDNDDNLKKPFHSRLSGCRLCIATYNATTYLETFAANFPTLLFWNPMHWELRDEAKPYFDLLHEAGILHYTPESLSAKLTEIYEDPMSWWNQQNIQAVKNHFCSQFANTQGDLKISIQKELLALSTKIS
jgi:putative transferase (TIGR04331 family)